MSSINKLRLPAVLLLLFLFGVSIYGQNPVSWSLSSPKKTAKAGEKFNVQLSGAIQGGWYIYSITQGAGGPYPTRVTVAAPFVLAGGVKGPAPKRQMDANFGIETEKYVGGANLTVPVSVPAGTAAGAQTLEVSVRFQTCNDEVCLPPKTVKVSAPIEIAAVEASALNSPTPTPTASPTPTPKNANVNANTNLNANLNVNTNVNVGTNVNTNSTTNVTPVTDSANIETNSVASLSTQNNNPTTPANFDNGGFSQDMPLWSFLWAALIAGALSLLTPCVFPMIPITVSYFTNHAGGSRRTATINAFVFALGIIFTFTILGVLLAVLFGAAGINQFAANPYVNIFIGVLFIAFAMSLFGAFNLGLPPSVLTKIDSFARGKESSQFVGLLLMGLVFSMTSFTCTTPLVGGLLVLATQGSWLYPILGMLAFSSVFALPFFILALAPQLVAQLPKSGGWLNSVKVVMGFLEIAAAMKFISNVDLVWGWGIFTREVVLATWVAVALLITLYLLGIFQLSHDMKSERLGAVRVMVSLVFLSLGFYLLTGLFGKTLGELESFLPPRTENMTTGSSVVGNGSSTKTEEWITNDYNAALAKAKAENKAVFIDFTGYTCTNCRWMEANMFPKPKVAAELDKFVRVRLYTDGEGEPYEGFQKMQEEKFSTVALPLYAVVDAGGNTLATFPGLTRDENTFVKFLQTGQEKLSTLTARAN